MYEKEIEQEHVVQDQEKDPPDVQMEQQCEREKSPHEKPHLWRQKSAWIEHHKVCNPSYQEDIREKHKS